MNASPPEEAKDALPETTARAVLAGVAVLAFAVRLWLTLHDDGIYWPDEIYQSLEPAHRLVFGYGFVAWEFVKGARNWVFPGFVALIFKVLGLLHVGSPHGLITGVKVVMSAASVATGMGVFVLVRRLGGKSWAALLAAAMTLLCAPEIYFAPRALSETASALPLVFGLALCLPLESARREKLLGAGLLVLATLLRLQCGLFCVVVLGVLLARRRWPDALQALGVFAAGALLYGLIDLWTWGGFFHSAIEYLRFNLVEGKASGWGTASPAYYLRVLFTAMPGVTLVTLGLAVFGADRARALTVAALAFIALHVLIPHKELRFFLPVLPLVFALAGLGAEVVARHVPRNWVLAAVSLVTLVSLAGFHHLTFGQLGQYEDAKPNTSAYDDFGSVNRLLFAAHDAEDLCGLKMEVAHLAWTGGYTALHRHVPFYPFNGPPRPYGFYNYVVTLPQASGGGQVVAQDGPFALVRLFAGPSCRPDPNFSDRLP